MLACTLQGEPGSYLPTLRLAQAHRTAPSSDAFLSARPLALPSLRRTHAAQMLPKKLAGPVSCQLLEETRGMQVSRGGAGAGGTHGGQDAGRVLPPPHTAAPASQPLRAAVMSFPLALLLLATASCRSGKAVLINYKPVLTAWELDGKITTSTFVLAQPRCVFNSTVSDTDEIWLVVALSNATSSFINPTSLQSLPAYQQFPQSPHYMTMGTSALNYPCESSSGQITVLRVGNETGCVLDSGRPDCNGPLPGPGPYRVKFLAMSLATGPKVETEWSDLIVLRTGKDRAVIDTWPRRRSAGMIVITTILSILLATLLACFLGALLRGCSGSAESAEIIGQQEPVTVKRYNTHHIYDQPAFQH